MNAEGEFFLSVSGSIESADFYEVSNAYCKYTYHFGPEWSVIAGIEEGLSQMSNCSNDARRLAVWNFPLDIAFKSTNPHGWPQLLLSIYGLDTFGHDVIRGYGACRLPLITGRHEKRIAVYVPESSSLLQQFAAWITGRRPELIDIGILATGDGRERKGCLVGRYTDLDLRLSCGGGTSGGSGGARQCLALFKMPGHLYSGLPRTWRILHDRRSFHLLFKPVTRMKVQGFVNVTFNVVLKDFFQLGFHNGERWR